MAIANAQVVCDGEPEDRESQVERAEGESCNNCHAARNSRDSSVEGICSSARASFHAVRALMALPRGEHFTLKQKTLRYEDLSEFIDSYSPGARHQRIESERFK